jgi:hypothetical protein
MPPSLPIGDAPNSSEELEVLPHVELSSVAELPEPSFDLCPIQADSLVGIVQRFWLHPATRPCERRLSLLLWTTKAKVREIVIPEAIAACCFPLILDGIGRCWSFSGLQYLEMRTVGTTKSEVLSRFSSSSAVIRSEATDSFCATPSKLWKDSLCTFSPPSLLPLQAAIVDGLNAGEHSRIAIVAAIVHITCDSLWLVDTTASIRVSLVGHLAQSFASESNIAVRDVVLLRDVRHTADGLQADRHTTIEKLVHGTEDSVVKCHESNWLMVLRSVDLSPDEPRADVLLEAAIATARPMIESPPTVPSFVWTRPQLPSFVSISGCIVSLEDLPACLCAVCSQPMALFSREDTQMYVCRRCAKLTKNGRKQVALLLADNNVAGTAATAAVLIRVSNFEVLHRVLTTGTSTDLVGQLVTGLLCTLKPTKVGTTIAERTIIADGELIGTC